MIKTQGLYDRVSPPTPPPSAASKVISVRTAAPAFLASETVGPIVKNVDSLASAWVRFDNIDPRAVNTVNFRNESTGQFWLTLAHTAAATPDINPLTPHASPFTGGTNASPTGGGLVNGSCGLHWASEPDGSVGTSGLCALYPNSPEEEDAGAPPPGALPPNGYWIHIIARYKPEERTGWCYVNGVVMTTQTAPMFNTAGTPSEESMEVIVGGNSTVSFCNAWFAASPTVVPEWDDPAIRFNFFDETTGTPIELEGTGEIPGVGTPKLYLKGGEEPLLNSATGNTLTPNNPEIPVTQSEEEVSFFLDTKQHSVLGPGRMFYGYGLEGERPGDILRHRTGFISLMYQRLPRFLSPNPANRLNIFYYVGAAEVRSLQINCLHTPEDPDDALVYAVSRPVPGSQETGTKAIGDFADTAYFHSGHAEFIHVLLYYNITDEGEGDTEFTGTLAVNGQEIPLTFDAMTPRSTSSVTIDHAFMYGASEGLGSLQHLAFYNADTIAANPGVPWSDMSAMLNRQDFVNASSGTPKWGGAKGESYISGALPDLCVNPANGMGGKGVIVRLDGEEIPVYKTYDGTRPLTPGSLPYNYGPYDPMSQNFYISYKKG